LPLLLPPLQLPPLQLPPPLLLSVPLPLPLHATKAVAASAGTPLPLCATASTAAAVVIAAAMTCPLAPWLCLTTARSVRRNGFVHGSHAGVFISRVGSGWKSTLDIEFEVRQRGAWLSLIVLFNACLRRVSFVSGR
jgi:hypothetical protein